MPNLTKRLVEQTPAPKRGKELRLWDDKVKGLHIRIKPSSVRTYYVSYRNMKGRLRRFAIGRHGIITLEEARKRAIQLLGQVAFDVDPMDERSRSRREPTFSDLANEYVERHASQKKSGNEDIRIIKKDLIKPWGHIPVREVKRRDVIKLVDRIKDRGSPIMANRTLAVIRRIFNFGISRDIVESNPTVLIRPPSKENRRDRVLNDHETVAFWNKLQDTDMSNCVKSALQLILITAQRPGEVINAEWSEIDLDNGWWTIPGEKSKNGLPHRVPLSLMALLVMGQLSKDNRFLFPGSLGSGRTDERPLTNRALSHAIRRNIDTFSIDRFTPHDLRRTAASHMASMGVSRLVIAKILNHAERDVTSVYDRHGYDAEKRTALNAWSQRLSDVIAGRKGEIIPLAR